MDRGDQWATDHGVTGSQKLLSMHALLYVKLLRDSMLWRAALLAQLVKNPPAGQETWV